MKLYDPWFITTAEILVTVLGILAITIAIIVIIKLIKEYRE